MIKPEIVLLLGMQRFALWMRKKAWILIPGILFLLFLLPIWLPAFFLTGDGPCHLYNSRMLLDFWLGNNQEIFTPFYDRNAGIDPNLFSHYSLAILMYFFSAAVAEKLLLTAYLSIWVSGWFLFSRRNGGNFILPVLISIPLAFHKPLLMGFYNFSFSLAFLPWGLMLGFYFTEKLSIRYFLSAFFVFTLLYFTHILGFVMCLGCLGGILLLDAIRNKHGIIKFTKRTLFNLVLPAAFPIALMIQFAAGKGIQSLVETESLREKIIRFFSLDFMVALSWHEEKLAMIFSGFLFVVLGTGLFMRIKSRRFHLLDGILLFLPFVLAFYFLQPFTVGSGGILEIRFRLIIWLIILVWLCTVSFEGRVKNLFILFSIGIAFGFLFLRIPRHIRAGDSVSAAVDIARVIEPGSIVLPLHFAFNGQDKRGMIGERIWLFMHYVDYIGGEIPVILLGNYEAHQNYFPFRWKENLDPFIQLGGEIEGQPPCADIEMYEKNTGKKIDYILTSNEWQSLADKPCYLNLREKLESEFLPAVVSADKRIRLYKRKS